MQIKKIGAGLLGMIPIAGIVSATDGYTSVYEGADIGEAVIDLIAYIMAAIAGDGSTIGSTIAIVIVLGLLASVIFTVTKLLGGLTNMGKGKAGKL